MRVVEEAIKQLKMFYRDNKRLAVYPPSILIYQCVSLLIDSYERAARREEVYKKAIESIRNELEYDEGLIMSNGVEDILREMEEELANV
jgi:hypothetical protein